MASTRSTGFRDTFAPRSLQIKTNKWGGQGRSWLKIALTKRLWQFVRISLPPWNLLILRATFCAHPALASCRASVADAGPARSQRFPDWYWGRQPCWILPRWLTAESTRAGLRAFTQKRIQSFSRFCLFARFHSPAKQLPELTGVCDFCPEPSPPVHGYLLNQYVTGDKVRAKYAVLRVVFGW